RAIEEGLFFVFPERTAKGESVSLSSIGQWDPQKVSFTEYMSLFVYGYEWLAMDPEIQENGNIQIADMEGFGWKQISKLGVSEVRTMMNICSNIFPIKHQKFIVVRENSFTNILFKIAQPFMGKDLKEKILFIASRICFTPYFTSEIWWIRKRHRMQQLLQNI
ncbi:Alpha-tocopherol transfer-like protein, partial [Leptotrombidium deliense]